MQGDKALFSSESVEWSTPPILYNWLNDKYNFVLDPCASDINHKCDCYFTKEDNGLARDWAILGDAAFMNPPYNKPESKCKPNCKNKRCLKRGYHNTEYVPGIGDWMRKAYSEAEKGMTVVCLVPNRSDTGWYRNYAMKADTIHNIGGRVHFIDYTNPKFTDHGQPKTTPSTFPSVIITFLGTRWREYGRPERPKLYYIEINKITNQITVI